VNRLKLKNRGNLKQVLEDEKERHRALKKKLNEKNKEAAQIMLGITHPEVILEIDRLQSDIERLETGLQEGGTLGQEIKRLNEENDRLRERTSSFIRESEQSPRETGEEEEERRRLEEYIRQEEQNKVYFFEDLKLFKREYEELKEENELLRQKVKNRKFDVLPDLSMPPSVPPTNDRLQQANAFTGDLNERLYRYRDLMSEMNRVMK
jgi:DNA repair exonuclease SbcCD ATPase subunit